MNMPRSSALPVEVLGVERRRRWSREAKAAMVSETYEPAQACRWSRVGTGSRPRSCSAGVAWPGAGRWPRSAGVSSRPPQVHLDRAAPSPDIEDRAASVLGGIEPLWLNNINPGRHAAAENGMLGPQLKLAVDRAVAIAPVLAGVIRRKLDVARPYSGVPIVGDTRNRSSCCRK